MKVDPSSKLDPWKYSLNSVSYSKDPRKRALKMFCPFPDPGGPISDKYSQFQRKWWIEFEKIKGKIDHDCFSPITTCLFDPPDPESLKLF